MHTTHPSQGSPEPTVGCPPPSDPARPIEADERPTLLGWLDDALRPGASGQLEAEFPISLDRSNVAGHRVVFAGGEPVAHAMLHVVEAHAGHRSLDVGLIGLVYTEPARRGQGLARTCVESCVAELSRRGVPVAALWTDRPALYAGVGFLPAGREDHYWIDSALCRRALHSAAQAGRERPIEVDVPRARDWSALEALYARKESRAVRGRGALRRLAGAPETRVVVARRAGRPLAYAAAGRGLDFPGVVHEWAGSESGVLACLEALCDELGPLGLRCGPVDEPPALALRESGALVQSGSFALMKVLDPVGLWNRVAAPKLAGPVLELEGCRARPRIRAAAGSLPLRPEDVGELFFGPDCPSRLRAFLSRPERDALDAVLPLPIYLWGFDSI